MEVIIIPNHRVPAVTHMIWYKIGSADDPPGKSGVAHYLEHMMFQGSKNLKPGEYAKIIARHGGQQNAFTHFDATSYYVSIAKEHLPLVMKLEAERMQGLLFSEADAAREKEVIIEERRMRIENSPAALFNEQINNALWQHHPYRIPIIGWMHEMQGLTREDVLDFWKAYYRPNNAILIISGDVTAAEMKPLAEKYYGGIKPLAPARFRWNEEPPARVDTRIEMHHANVKEPLWERVWALPSVGQGKEKEALALMVAAHGLGGSNVSRLYQAIVKEQKLATDIDADYNGFSRGPGKLIITASPTPGVDFPQLEAAVEKVMTALVTEGFTDEEIERSKTLLKAETIYARDGLSSVANVMGWIRMCGLSADYFSRWPGLIDAVTAEEAKAAIGLVLSTHHLTGTLLPEAKEASDAP